MPHEDFCGIPQSLHIKTKIVPQGHDYFIPNPFLFVTHLSSYYHHSIAADTDSIANRPCKMKSSSMFSFKYDQQDALLYNILHYHQCPTCFRRFLHPSSGAQNYKHSIWYMSSFQLTHTSGSSKQAWHIPDAVCTVLSSWWWVKKPPETRRALTVIKNIV
jgi:hypothetical protein